MMAGDGFVMGADMDLKPGGPGVEDGAATGETFGKEGALGWKPFAVMLCFTSQWVSCNIEYLCNDKNNFFF